jgi:hypothetical protein
MAPMTNTTGLSLGSVMASACGLYRLPVTDMPAHSEQGGRRGSVTPRHDKKGGRVKTPFRGNGWCVERLPPIPTSPARPIDSSKTRSQCFCDVPNDRTVALEPGGQVSGDGVLDDLEQRRRPVRRPHLELVQQLDCTSQKQENAREVQT